MRARRAVHPDRRRSALRRSDGRPARALEPNRPREDRAVCEGPRRPLRVPPRLPGRSPRSRMRLPSLGDAAHRRERADRVRARRLRACVPGESLSPVLALLPVQRLQQHARRRLGDDPARLRRERCRGGARAEAGRDRIQRARGRRASVVGWRQAGHRRRHAPGDVSSRWLARQQVQRSTLARQLGGGWRWVRRHAWSPHGADAESGDHPRRSEDSRVGVPVDCVRGALGRAPVGVLQRADGSEHEDPVDEADHLV